MSMEQLASGPNLAGGRPGAQPGHNFDLKSGGTKLEAPKGAADRDAEGVERDDE